MLGQEQSSDDFTSARNGARLDVDLGHDLLARIARRGTYTEVSQGTMGSVAPCGSSLTAARGPGAALTRPLRSDRRGLVEMPTGSPRSSQRAPCSLAGGGNERPIPTAVPPGGND